MAAASMPSARLQVCQRQLNGMPETWDGASRRSGKPHISGAVQHMTAMAVAKERARLQAECARQLTTAPAISHLPPGDLQELEQLRLRWAALLLRAEKTASLAGASEGGRTSGCLATLLRLLSSQPCWRTRSRGEVGGPEGRVHAALSVATWHLEQCLVELQRVLARVTVCQLLAFGVASLPESNDPSCSTAAGQAPRARWRAPTSRARCSGLPGAGCASWRSCTPGCRPRCSATPCWRPPPGTTPRARSLGGRAGPCAAHTCPSGTPCRPSQCGPHRPQAPSLTRLIWVCCWPHCRGIIQQALGVLAWSTALSVAVQRRLQLQPGGHSGACRCRAKPRRPCPGQRAASRLPAACSTSSPTPTRARPARCQLCWRCRRTRLPCLLCLGPALRCCPRLCSVPAASSRGSSTGCSALHAPTAQLLPGVYSSQSSHRCAPPKLLWSCAQPQQSG